MQTSIVAKLDGLRSFGRIHILDDSSENLRLGEGEELARFHAVEKVVPLVQQQIHAPRFHWSSASITLSPLSMDCLTFMFVVRFAAGGISPIWPTEFSVSRIAHTNDALVGHPVRGEDCLVGPKQTDTDLHRQFKINCHVEMFPGPRPRELLHVCVSQGWAVIK